MVTPNPAGSLGSYLRALREKKHVSLQDIAHSTRVSLRQLQALESDETAALPAPVFVRGFIRAYCHFLGESADEALARMPAVATVEPPRPRAVPRSASTVPSWVGSPVFISLVLLALFGGGLLMLNLLFTPAPQPATSAPPPTIQGGAAGTPPTPIARSPEPSDAARGGTQHLVLNAVEPAWVRIQADDGKSIEELLPPGATREWTAQKRFVLTVGNAGGITLTLNGRRLPSLGGRGVVIRGLELPLTDPAPAS